MRRYGIEMGNLGGHLSVQSSAVARIDNVLNLDRLTYHSRVLKIGLDAVMVTKRHRQGQLINSPEAVDLRLSGPNPLPITTRGKAGLLKPYAPFSCSGEGCH